MGLFNGICRFIHKRSSVGVVGVLLLTLSAVPVSAFEPGATEDSTRISSDNVRCQWGGSYGTNIYGWNSNGRVYIHVTGSYDFQHVTGGSYWQQGFKAIPGSGPITEDAMTFCFEDYTPGTLIQKGADATSYNEQYYMGFGYKSTTLGVGWVEYIIGNGTLEQPTPAVPSNAPTALVATPGNGQVRIDFTAPSDDGGAAITDYEYQLDGGDWIASTTDSSPVLIMGLTNGTSYSIKLRAVNSAGVGAASEAVSVLLGSPASAFAAKVTEITQVINDTATRSLTSTLNANERMVGEARERLIASQQEGADLATRDNVPFDVDGTFNLDGSRLSTKGTFFEQRGTADGAGQRLFFGDFDVQHDGDTNSTTATITARMAWEQMYTDSTMLGYFVGGELAHSNIKGSFEGEQDRLGVSFGGYAVHQLDEQVFVDGFITVGAGRNNLEIADDTLDLTSDYDTRTATMGAAVSGVYEYGQYDFHPELAFSYGKTWIGDVGFTGVAYGLTDDTLSLDAGDVSIANLTLRPEIVWALDAETVADSNTQLSFAPRFICQRTSAAATTQDCGAGAEIGLSSTSEDGLGSANIRLVMDRVGNSNRSSFALNFERRF